MAARYAIDGARAKAERMIEQTNAFIAQHEAQMKQVAARVREREKCPPLSEWDFSAIDPVTFAGEVRTNDERRASSGMVGENNESGDASEKSANASTDPR